MDSGEGLYNSGHMAFSKALQNEARINRLEIILKDLCSKLGVEIQWSDHEEPDPQLMECMRLMDECVEESRASSGRQGSCSTPRPPA